LPHADTHPADAMPMNVSSAVIASDGPSATAADTW
jgi:hypothetical protein